jgi:hypothetical protein
MLNFATLESARCFATAWVAFFKERDTVSPETLFRDLYERIPTFMLCVGDDDIAGCPQTFPSHPNLVVEVLERGGHEIHPDMEVWSDIVCRSLMRFYKRTFPDMAVGL